MGYVKNHLATLVCGVFASVLTFLWAIMPPALGCTNPADCSALHLVFIMANGIMWFLVFIIWIAQKAADYNHASTSHSSTSHAKNNIVYTSDGKKKVLN